MDQPQFITTTQAVDPVFYFIFGACLVLLVAITTVMVMFVIRYRRSRSPVPTSTVASNLWLEIVWTLFPTLLVMAMFWYGWAGYLSLRTVPKDALEVTATARMWSWSFTYANGKTASRLYVPVNRAIRVDLVSRDVLHGFFLPSFRVKRDVVPGMKNFAWFVADQPGSYDLFCSQYCGTNHSAMITTVEALPGNEFEAWLHEGSPARGAGPAAGVNGRKLAEAKGCLACHSLDGTKGVGPTFKGIMGRQVTVVTNGKERVITVDADYLRKSIREPTEDVVKGYQPIMPPFADLTPEEITALIDFLKGVN